MISTAVCTPPRSCQTIPSQGYLAHISQDRWTDGEASMQVMPRKRRQRLSTTRECT